MGGLRENLQERWDDLEPSKRRWIVLGTSVVFGISLLYSVMYAAGETGGPRTDFEAPSEDSRSLLTSSSSQDMSISALSAEMEQLRTSRRNLESQVTRLERELEQAAKQEDSGSGDSSDSGARTGPDEVTQRKINALTAQIETLRQAIQDQEYGGSGDEIAVDTIGGDDSDSDLAREARAAQRQRERSLFERESDQGTPDRRPPQQQGASAEMPQPGSSGGNGQNESGESQNDGSSRARARVSVFAQGEDGTTSTMTSVEEAAVDQEGGSDEDKGVYVPAGSMISGTLLTGLDAPTGSQARSEPIPVLLRVKHEAILPNRFRADVRECFLVASGFGSISASRVRLRSESLSCIREDGGVVEAGIGAWAVSGEDGKEGIEGRLVSRQGEVLGRSMIAGFASGFSQLFGQQQVPQLDTNPDSNGNMPYQSVFTERAAQAATVQGAGQALDRLAQFYIDMAEEMFPVIEVNAGRRVTFVVNQGTQLRIRGNTAG